MASSTTDRALAGTDQSVATSQAQPDQQDERAAEILRLGEAFRSVFACLRRLRGRDTHLPGMELSHAQCELLFELSERGELSVGELASAAQLTPATVTQMLEHLAENGHVERTRLESDRRVVRSRLTPRGRRELELKRERSQRRWGQAMADFDVQELRAATRVLRSLRTVFEDVEGCVESERTAESPRPGSKP
jgi:DNA-binding MarR family transcriptional regulator